MPKVKIEIPDSKIKGIWWYDDAMAIHFYNGEIIIFDGDQLWQPNDFDNEGKVELGLMSQDEYDAIERNNELYYAKQAEERERREYERLKAKYEQATLEEV